MQHFFSRQTFTVTLDMNIFADNQTKLKISISFPANFNIATLIKFFFFIVLNYIFHAKDDFLFFFKTPLNLL